MLSANRWHVGLLLVWCICLDTASVLARTGEHFVQFIPTPGVVSDRFYYESPGSVHPIEVDASTTQQVRIRIVDFLNNNPELKLHCHVAPLSPDSELTSAFLCRKTSVTANSLCVDPKTQTPQWGEIAFNAIGNRSHGYTFHAELLVGRVLLDAFYFCKFRNKWGELNSNMVEVQDVYYYQIAMVKRDAEKPQYLPTIKAPDLPMRLDCGTRRWSEKDLPTWADHSFPSPFLWSFCELSGADGYTDYQCMNKVRKHPIGVSDYFEHVVYPNGTLILLGRTAAAWKYMGLLCRSHIRSAVIFSVFFGGTESNPGPLMYDPNVPYADSSFRPLSPMFQKITVRQGPGSGTQLVAVYRGSRSFAKTEWTKDGGRIPFGFPEPTAFALTFPELIQRNHSGLYELHVSGRHPSIRFQFEVTVVGPPEVIQDPPALLLVMEGHEAMYHTEIASYSTTTLRINGEVFFPGSPQEHRKLSNHFPYLKDVKIHPLDIQGPRIQYRASNLVFTPGSSFGSTHTVTIEGANEFGYARVSTLINVLPRPTFLKLPADCAPRCLSSEEHTFSCEVDLRPYAMAHIIQSWDWNGTDISVLRGQGDARADYFQTEGITLRLLPVRDPSRVSLFANSLVTCRIRIYYKAVQAALGNSEDVERVLQDSKWIVYDSRTDSEIQGLSSKVDLQLDSTRSTVDRKERASGHDPDKELLENKNFQIYERPDLPPLRGSRCSLNDYSAEIGSDADGELDDYNLDPGKFNEEGSFIDQYTTETHYKSTSRLPTLSGQYQSLA
ncbi:hypothetical protein CSKR_106527 [Clonorchis sinensis]|uniref:Neurofascin/L1/NrCAM C-terminal domain-containing protein n=1 Tax=Clonorchis sinensis TaxID=79923 RepID=A0A8T1MZH5_CLOSI|nr:hypothetical protein CSKR_106527 [Clonorchis sinensis]